MTTDQKAGITAAWKILVEEPLRNARRIKPMMPPGMNQLEFETIVQAEVSARLAASNPGDVSYWKSRYEKAENDNRSLLASIAEKDEWLQRVYGYVPSHATTITPARATQRAVSRQKHRGSAHQSRVTQVETHLL